MDWNNLNIKHDAEIIVSGITRSTPSAANRTSCSLIDPLAILIVILYTLAPPSAASTNRHTCENSPISIETDDSVDHLAICNSAEDALAFFGRLDMNLSCPIVIEVVQNLPDWMSETAVGCYQEEEQTAFVLTFPAFEKREKWFGIPVNRSMYRSLVTHEVAHAVASCNFTIPEPTIHAKEYLAYVAMFAMMNPVLRARVLMKNPGVGFESESEINEVTYSFNPMRFGVEAYRHHLKKEHGDAFLLKTLSGTALTNSVDYVP